MRKEQQDCRVNTKALPSSLVHLFRTCSGDPFLSSTTDWEGRHFYKVNDAIIEFVGHNKASHGVLDVPSSTSKSYIFSLQRAFEMK